MTSDTTKNFYEAHHEGLRLYIKVKPNARQSGMLSEVPLPERLYIQLAAPPHEGEANKALIVFLANHLKIAKSRISLEKGQTSRLKTIFIKGKEEETETWLTRLNPTQTR